MLKVLARLLVLVLLYSCQSDDRQESSFTSIEHENVEEETEEVISPKLYAEIKSLTAKLDTLTSVTIDIIAVSFIKEEEDCYLYLGPVPFYDRRYWSGYCILNQNMIIFNVLDSACSFGIVKVDHLHNDGPAYYPNESTRHTIGSIEPWGRKYRIHGNDSLELVYEGYL